MAWQLRANGVRSAVADRREVVAQAWYPTDMRRTSNPVRTSLALAELVPLALQAFGLVWWFRQAHVQRRMTRAYWLRTGFGLILLIFTMAGCGLLFVRFEIGLGIAVD